LSAFRALYKHQHQRKARLDREGCEQLVHDAGVGVGERLLIDGPTDSIAVASFVRSGELRTIVHQLLAYRVVNGSGSLPGSVRESFDAAAALYGVRSTTEGGSREMLLGALSQACEQIVTLTRIGLDSMSEVDRSTITTRVLSGQLDSLRRTLEHLTERPDLGPEYSRFAKSYAKLVVDRHSTIVTPHWDAAPRVPLDSVYIDTPVDDSAWWRRGGVFPGFIINRDVVLGDPGAGKSTLATKLVRDLADGRIAIDEVQYLPFLVVLRLYEAARDTISFVEYIERLCEGSYELSPPRGAIEYLLLSGRGCIVFDGLDELLDTSRRREMADKIDTFSQRYPNVPILVTSRKTGYSQAPLGDSFTTHTLSQFDENQVHEYVERWFMIAPDLSLSDRTKWAKQFLITSSIVPDLRRNPLLLALLCNLYRSTQYRELPRTRPAIYEQCALTLYHRWDRDRRIGTVEFERDFLPVLAYIADRIIGNASYEAGVKETTLIELAHEYLYPTRFEDEFEARAFARNLIGHCVGRGWVFADTGSTRSGELLFQFTHRTFLEYFAALYLVRRDRSPEKLLDSLWPLILGVERTVVTQLAFQIMSRPFDNAADDFLDMMLGRLHGLRDSDRARIILWAAEAASLSILSVATLRRLAEQSIDATSLGTAGRQAVEMLLKGPPDNIRTVARHSAECLIAARPSTRSIELEVRTISRIVKDVGGSYLDEDTLAALGRVFLRRSYD